MFTEKDVECDESNFSVECSSDTTCSCGTCIDHCRDPIVAINVCGEGAICETVNHFPECRCPDGWDGVPTDKCTKRMCVVLVIKNQIKKFDNLFLKC